jgi:hypothetical protein
VRFGKGSRGLFSGGLKIPEPGGPMHHLARGGMDQWWFGFDFRWFNPKLFPIVCKFFPTCEANDVSFLRVRFTLKRLFIASHCDGKAKFSMGAQQQIKERINHLASLKCNPAASCLASDICVAPASGRVNGTKRRVKRYRACTQRQ